MSKNIHFIKFAEQRDPERVEKVSKYDDGKQIRFCYEIDNNDISYRGIDLVDFEKEKERLTKEKEKLEKELARSRGMLSNEKFMSKAPEAKVAEEREKLAKYEAMMAQVEARLASMK